MWPSPNGWSKRAHAKGIGLEAELGRLGGVEEDVQVEEGSAFLTDPKEAVEFVTETAAIRWRPDSKCWPVNEGTNNQSKSPSKVR
jgi:hypothetical protein